MAYVRDGDHNMRCIGEFVKDLYLKIGSLSSLQLLAK